MKGRAGALAAAVAVTLAACSTSTAPDPGLNAQQLAAYRELSLNLMWTFTGLGDDLRPATPAITLVTDEGWIDAYVGCMNSAGFDQYVVSVDGGSYSVTGDALMGSRATGELIADYVCSASFEVDGRYDRLYNPAQIDYLFDYYQQVLVPCLQVRGFDIATPPTREQYVAGWGGWHPYFAVIDSQQDRFFDDPRVPEECPPTPAGMPDPGYASLWQR